MNCQCFAHSFLFSSHLASGSASSSSFKICTPPLHAFGFVILCSSPALLFSGAPPPSSLLHFLRHFVQSIIPLLQSILPSCMEPRLPSYRQTPPPTSFSSTCLTSSRCFFSSSSSSQFVTSSSSLSSTYEQSRQKFLCHQREPS